MAQRPFQITPSTRRATRQPRGQPTPPFPISSTAGMTPEQIATQQANIEEERRGQTGGNIKLAVIAQEVYDEPSKRTGRDGWKYVSGDKRHGIWSRDGKAVVGIRGTDFKDAKDLADDVAIGVGALKLTPRYRRAKKWVKKAIKKYGKKNVEVAGHSLGGKISKELAKDFGIKGSTFNAGASVSDAASSILDRTACKINKKGKRCKRAKKVENYRTAIDPVSAAAVADLNTTTVKRKKGKDPHAIANFVDEQEGEGFEDLPKNALIEIWNSLDNSGRRNLYVILPEAARRRIDEFTAEIEGVQPPASPPRPSRRITQPPPPPRKRHRGRGEEQEGGYYGMRGYGSKRYEFTQVGGGRRRRGKKSKNMVEVMPPVPSPPAPKKKVLSQKEYCSLYRC